MILNIFLVVILKSCRRSRLLGGWNMSEAIVEVYLLIAAWCGPVVSAGNRPAETVQTCREQLIACIEKGGKESCFKNQKLR
jgi:hypothetical protein